jgi:diketogulonate reductase-like aldo/keto reductase
MLSATLIRTAQLPSGEAVPVLGQGTWGLAEGKHDRDQEIRALRLGLELGMSLIDTAEMYANGETEKLVGEAIHGHRDETFLVSKVLPQNASRTATIAACERSLRRLKTPWLDLYLLHWRGSIPLRETIEGFETLLQVGKIRYWGVSNFDVGDMEELVDLPHGSHVAANQVLYNLARRGIEYDLMSWCRNRKIPIMAYSPVEQGRLLKNRELQRVADRLNAKPAQVALAWVLRQAGTIAIPRAGTLEHVREDRAALELHLTEEDMKALDGAFPPPSRKRPLEIL